MENATPSADIPKIAALARIELTPEETAEMEKDIGKILEYMTILNQADVSDIQPTAHIAGLANVMRDDVSAESGLRDDLLAQSPALVEDVLVKVPAVLPGEGMS